MSLVAKASAEGGFTPIPPGMHLARCYRVIDMGTQKSEYLGQIKHLPKVMLQFEVHGEDDAGNPLVTAKNEPMTISKNYTLSLSEKATLRRDLSTWRGRDFTPEEQRGFELKNLLGVWAMISVTRSTGNNGKEYTNIAAVMPVPAKVKQAGLPEGHNKPVLFSILNADMTVFDGFSEYLKTKIMSSPEWQSRGSAKKADEDAFDSMTDDIPF